MTKQLLMLFLMAGMALTGVATPQTPIQAEEYAVFSAVIEDRYSSGSTRSIVIVDQTVIHAIYFIVVEDLDFVHQRLPSIQQQMFDDFKSLNKQSYPLSRSFNIKKQYVFVSEAQLGEIFKSRATGGRPFTVNSPNHRGVSASQE